MFRFLHIFFCNFAFFLMDKSGEVLVNVEKSLILSKY